MKNVIAIAAFMLAGCAGSVQPQATWDKPGGTLAENDRDDRECNYEAKKVFYANINSPLMGRYLGSQTFAACMTARGYQSSSR